MATITISINDDVDRIFREEVEEHIGKGKGTLSKAITEAMELWIETKKQEDTAKELKEILNKGYDMGKITYKTRDELHARK
ncbi:MAG: hypothetical protein AABX38_06815 [Candidatus Micrarchaeota archaeon]